MSVDKKIFISVKKYTKKRISRSCLFYLANFYIYLDTQMSLKAFLFKNIYMLLVNLS